MADNFPHKYTGPDTRDGLTHNQPCRIVGNRAGGRQIIVPQDKRVYIVARIHVQTKEPS